MFPGVTCPPNVGMWRYGSVEMLENGNVGLLRCGDLCKVFGIGRHDIFDTLPRPCFRCPFACLTPSSCLCAFLVCFEVLSLLDPRSLCFSVDFGKHIKSGKFRMHKPDSRDIGKQK